MAKCFSLVPVSTMYCNSMPFNRTDNILCYSPLLYSFNRCCTDVIAPNTDNLFTRLLMFEAVPNSSANILATRDI